jgi:hypothetical protein
VADAVSGRFILRWSRHDHLTSVDSETFGMSF